MCEEVENEDILQHISKLITYDEDGGESSVTIGNFERFVLTMQTKIVYLRINIHLKNFAISARTILCHTIVIFVNLK